MNQKKKEELAQLGRTQGPKPGSSPAPAEPAQPRTLSLSLTARPTPPVGAVVSNVSSLSLSRNAGSYLRSSRSLQ
jgi:hypothetical protein